MCDVKILIQKLRDKGIFTPEYEGTNVSETINKHMLLFGKMYPQIYRYKNYLDFLSLTGGAEISSNEFSFGIYGFGGYLVRSVDELPLVDLERYFVFGDMVFLSIKSPTYYFAFDIFNEHDLVYMATDEVDNYTLCCDSFFQLLLAFVDGSYRKKIQSLDE